MEQGIMTLCKVYGKEQNCLTTDAPFLHLFLQGLC